MNREVQEMREVITKLVPLLTGKGLAVTQRGSQAYVKTDPKTRRPIVVNIPSISDNASPEFIRAIQGYIDHEVAHVLITDWNYYAGGPTVAELRTAKVQQFMQTHNIVEDTMIEREIVKIFPGSRKNIADLREMFIKDISLPAIKKAAGDDKEQFRYLIVPLMRALAGHDEFIEMMDKGNYWENPYCKGVTAGLKPETLKALKACTSTKETLAISRELHEILFPPAPPPPPKPPAPTPPPPPPSKSEDKPDKKAEAGEGTGERDHDDEDEDADDAPAPGASADPKKDKEDDDAPAPETDDDDGIDDDDADADPAPGAAEPDDDDDDDDSADESDDPEVDDDDFGSSLGEDPEDEDDAGEDDEDDLGGSGGGSGGVDEDDDASAQIGIADEDQEDSEGGGIGMGEDGLSKSIFDFDDDAFEGADLSSSIASMLSDEAVETMSSSDYNVFTKEFDRIEHLVPPTNMDATWVPVMEERIRSMVGRLQKDIERLMASQSHVIRTPGHRRGKLHAPSLFRVTQGDDRVFSIKEEHVSKDTAVMLLIDNSGSMHGSKMETAMLSGYALSSTLDRVNIAHEVIGFTTGDYRGAPQVLLDALEEEREEAKVHYHRFIPLMMPIYKDFDERLSPLVKQRIAYAANAQKGLSGNIDGECLEYAAARLMKRREKRKVMIVFSDGNPVGDQAGPHLKTVVRDLEKKWGIDCIGIGIEDASVKKYYPKSVVLSSVEELPGQVMGELKKILA